MASIPANLPPSAGFDGAGWLTAWSEHGGIYLLVGDRLYLRRSTPIEPSAGRALDRLISEILRSGGGPDIAAHLRRQREGEVA